MYVSDDIIFIHVPRCAGTTIRGALTAPDSFKSGIPPGARAHDSAIRAKELIGKEAWERAWSFTVVRNPWDRLISLFELCRSPGKSGDASYRLRAGIQRHGRNDPPLEILCKKIHTRGFEWWLLDFCERYVWNPYRLDENVPLTRMPACHWVYDKDGATPLDKVFRFETDMAAIRRELKVRRGAIWLPNQNRKAHERATYLGSKTLNRLDRSEYFSTKRLNRWVEENFAQDIEAFGYKR